MGCVKTVVPWLVDPIGMAIQTTTGFGYTPGGVLNTVLNPPPKPAATTPAAPPAMPPPPPPPPPPPWHPAPIKSGDPRSKAEHEGAGAGAGADRTRGLVVSGQKSSGQGRSLLG